MTKKKKKKNSMVDLSDFRKVSLECDSVVADMFKNICVKIDMSLPSNSYHLVVSQDVYNRLKGS